MCGRQAGVGSGENNRREDVDRDVVLLVMFALCFWVECGSFSLIHVSY